jgi:hypothetical protein
MIILSKIFYFLSLIFIWSEFYHIRHKDYLYIRLDKRDITNSSISDYIFYITKLVYIPWVLIGLFSKNSFYFLLIVLISSIKFLVLLFKSKKFTEIYDIVSSSICIIIVSYLFLKTFNLV